MSQNITLNIGNTWDWNFLNEIIRLNKEVSPTTGIYITSIYGSLSWLTSSARSADRLPHFPYNREAGDAKDLVSYIETAQKAGIAIRYTLNQSCIGSMSQFNEESKTLIRSLHRLHDELGIKQFTVTSPLIAELVIQELHDAFIEVSTICEVDDPQKLSRWQKLGALGVCLKLDANRACWTLYEMAHACDQTNMRLELLANEFCIFRCPYRQECYNLSSHNSIRGPFNHYPYDRCQQLRILSPYEWVRARFVLPQWMAIYKNDFGISEFKITGRTHPTEAVLPIIKAYVYGEIHGNLLDLWPPVAKLGATIDQRDTLYIDVDTIADTQVLDYFLNVCEGDCTRCKYCKKLFEKARR